jgi:hypothetical protein
MSETSCCSLGLTVQCLPGDSHLEITGMVEGDCVALQLIFGISKRQCHVWLQRSVWFSVFKFHHFFAAYVFSGTYSNSILNPMFPGVV